MHMHMHVSLQSIHASMCPTSPFMQALQWSAFRLLGLRPHRSVSVFDERTLSTMETLE